MKKPPKNNIRPGLDYLTTIVAHQRIIIPGDRLGGATSDFDEIVTFIGARLSSPVGNADTIMERLEEMEFGKPVRTRLVAFANVSAAPIRMQIGDDEPIYFDLYVTLSPTTESPGETIYYTKDGHSGDFQSNVNLSPLFELRPLGRHRESIFIDTGKTPIPGFPMRLGTAGGKWSRRPQTNNAVRSYGGETIYYTTEVFIKALEEDGHSTLAACAKRQAEFVGLEEPGEFDRVNFPNPKAFANLEIDRWRRE